MKNGVNGSTINWYKGLQYLNTLKTFQQYIQLTHGCEITCFIFKRLEKGHAPICKQFDETTQWVNDIKRKGKKHINQRKYLSLNILGCNRNVSQLKFQGTQNKQFSPLNIVVCFCSEVWHNQMTIFQCLLIMLIFFVVCCCFVWIKSRNNKNYMAIKVLEINKLEELVVVYDYHHHRKSVVRWIVWWLIVFAFRPKTVSTPNTHTILAQNENWNRVKITNDLIFVLIDICNWKWCVVENASKRDFWPKSTNIFGWSKKNREWAT